MRKKKHNNSWSEYFRHVQEDGLGRASFYLKDSRSWLFTYDGYMGGHDLLDEVLSICQKKAFPKKKQGSDSPLNISNRETFFAFLDGGIEVFEGNYFFGERAQGAYIRGFNAFRWILCELGIPQPRKFKKKDTKRSCEELKGMLDVAALPFVAIGRSRPVKL